MLRKFVMNKQLNTSRILTLFTLLALSACSRSNNSARTDWLNFFDRLADTRHFASVTPESGGYLSTADPTGANNDYNHFQGASREKGWVVLADLKGPGVLDRFWMTGVDEDFPIRFYFDGEKKPRIAQTVDELFGANLEPFVYPFSQHVNQCWWSYVPLTYAKSLRIEAPYPPVHRFWGQRRLYIQANYRSLPDSVQSFPEKLPPPFPAQEARVSKALTDSLRTDIPLTFSKEPVLLEPETRKTLFTATGPATFTNWAIHMAPQDSALPESVKNALLQQVVLEITYEDSETPSVSVPLGDFFCNAWRKRNLSCLALSSVDDGYLSRLPLSCAQSLRVSLNNRSAHAVSAAFNPGEPTERIASDGYLHAVWNKTGPEQKGRPHPFASLKGKGKYVGCYLAVTSLDQSWWILEGDEIITTDGRQFSGTGLEDYFNGGWYYRGCSFSPYSGVLDRYPFRTGQYRFHLQDAVYFNRDFSMTIERGDQNVSAGTMRSTAYFYLEKPQPVPNASSRADTIAEVNPYESYSLMLQLFELERARDYHACIRQIDEWLETNAASTNAGVLQLRRLEYRRLLNESVSRDDYAPYLAGEQGEPARQQAEQLLWFYEKPNRYLLGAVNNVAGQVAVNGKTVMTKFHPLQLMVTGLELPDGTNTIQITGTPNRAVPWVQTGIRSHQGLAGTGQGCRVVRSTGEQEFTLPINVMRGPPHDENYVNAEPNAFVLLQSEIYGIRAHNWDAMRDRSDFFVDFNTMNMSASPFGQAVLGLPSAE